MLPYTLSFPPEVIIPFPTLSKLYEETNTHPLQPLLRKIDIDNCLPAKPIALHK